MGHFPAMNHLKMELRHSIIALLGRGWSHRKIARELEIHRETVGRYARLAAAGVKPAIPPAGSDDSKPAIPPAGSNGSKPAIPPTGRPSECEPFREFITQQIESGLSAQRIYQDLVNEHHFAASYDSVKRFVRRLAQGTPLPFRRMECLPAEEAQVDYGQGAWVVEGGKRRRPHLLRVVLSHSRKGYAEVFWQQTTENFIRGLENAFRHFGGVPANIVIDNLRAAVKRADWYDPQLNPKVLSFAEHYSCTFMPTRPAMPRHKGKVEAGVKYVQSNALAKRTFGSLAEQNEFLARWETSVADTRIHGTTRQQIRQCFEDREKPALRSLPLDLFPVFEEGPRQVHRDGHVEVRKAYYSVPPEYVGRKVWVRWDTKLVRVYNQRWEQITVHVRNNPGAYSTLDEHIHAFKRSAVERGAEYLLQRAGCLGTSVDRWARAMYQNRGVEGLRVLQGLLSLAETTSPKHLNQACAAATAQTLWHLRGLRELLAHPVQQDTMSFMEEHPVIRPLKDYGELIEDCFSQTDNQTTEDYANTNS